MSARNRLIFTFSLFSTSLITLAFPTPIAAQQENSFLEIVSSFKLDGNAGESGDIIARILPENVLRLATRVSNESVVGVLIPESLSVVTYRGADNEKLVAQRGVYPVNVTNINGDIFPGDFITTSTLAGKGQKASSVSEAILGMAVEEFTAQKGQATQLGDKTYYTGTIMVDLTGRPHYQNLGVFKEVLNLARSFGIAFLGQFQTSEGSSLFFRYLLAAVVTILCVWFAFRHFGTSILRGIEAIGRNPLARGHIQSAIIINAVIIILVSISVVVLSIFIVKL